MSRVAYDYKVHSFDAVYSWVKKNCKGSVRFGQGWDSWVDFENEMDASFFALKWGS